MAEVCLRRLGWVASFTRHSAARTPGGRILPAPLLCLSRVARQAPSPAEAGVMRGSGGLPTRRVGVCLPQLRSTDSTGWGVLRRVPRVPFSSYRSDLHAIGAFASGFSLIAVFHEGSVVLARCGVVTQAQPVAPVATNYPSSRGFAPTPGDCFIAGQNRMFHSAEVMTRLPNQKTSAFAGRGSSPFRGSGTMPALPWRCGNTGGFLRSTRHEAGRGWMGGVAVVPRSTGILGVLVGNLVGVPGQPGGRCSPPS
jgi:hypothetical protein